MSKKLKKVKTRLATTIPANYSLEDSQERNMSGSGNYKLKTLITEKIEMSNQSKLNSKTKRVYITNLNKLTQNQNIKTQSPLKEEETLQSLNADLKHRYMTRVKSSNGRTIQSSGLLNQRSVRHTHKLNKLIKNINDVQFESELYWNGNSSYLVTGVKNQYEKIKKAYEEKCTEIEKIKRDYNADQAKQLKIYIEKLQKENNRLIEVCQKLRSKLQKQKQANSHLPELVLQKYRNSQGNQIIENQLNEIYQRYEKLHKKLLNLQNKNSALGKQNKNLVTKVFLQQKIIIESQNRQFKLNSLCKKLEKQILEVKQNLRKNQGICQIIQKTAESNLSDVKVALKQQFTQEKKSLLEKIRQKDSKIEKMDKEVLHMKSLLQSWKNSEEVVSNQHEEQQKKISDHHQRFSVILQQQDKIRLKLKNQVEKGSAQSINTQNHSVKPPSQRSLNNGTFRAKGDSNRTAQRIAQKNVKRQRVTGLTHKEGSVRCRPVEMHDIERILEYIRLKLAFSRVNPAEVTNFFDHGQDKNVSIGINETKKENGEESSQWEAEYITTKEIYDVYLKDPFSVNETEALLLSRFIVEDVKEPYIYMNWDSQNSRRMAKSIISNLLTFETLSNSTIEKSEQLLKKYETILLPALKSVSKSGRISREKFIQILNGLGLERTKYMDEYIIGKMCHSSQGLDTLDFSSLYEQSAK